MAAPLLTPRKLSATAAAGEAMGVVGRRLFPFRLDRWLPLGFVTFLDHCGRSGGGGSGGGGPSRLANASGNSDSAGATAHETIGTAREWIGEHFVVIAAVSAIALVLIVALLAVVLWLNSRGVFMYADNVASGRFDVARPWREHADRAWSYFGWSLGSTLIGFFGVLLLLVPGLLFGISLFEHGASAGPILGIVGVVLLFLLWVVALNLFQVLLRDFAAPLQMSLDVPCGRALGVAWRLARANPITFIGYVLLKVVFAIVAGIAALLAGCATCCLGFLPVISHTLLQPLYYFERAWSLCLLRQAGYDLFPAEPPPPPAPLPIPAPLPV